MNLNTAISEFEKFFSTDYKEEVFNILEKYPQEKSLIISYQSLEMFDPELADLLIEKPEEIIECAKKAIKNIDPLIKNVDINIRFENLSNNIALRDLDSYYINEFISVDGKFSNIKEPVLSLKTAVFECNGCMRLHEVEQNSTNELLEPSLCSECGGRSFRLLQGESEYINFQDMVIKSIWNDTSRKLEVVLTDDLCSYDDYYIGQPVRLTGILKVYKDKNNATMHEYLYVNNIELLDYHEDDDIEYDYSEEGARDSPEYNQWRQEVINRDKSICQCCGAEKYPHAHHIFSYKNYPDLRLDVNNGITLCKWCHEKYHSLYGIRDANFVDLNKFLNRFGRRTNNIIIKESKGDEL